MLRPTVAHGPAPPRHRKSNAGRSHVAAPLPQPPKGPLLPMAIWFPGALQSVCRLLFWGIWLGSTPFGVFVLPKGKEGYPRGHTTVLVSLPLFIHPEEWNSVHGRISLGVPVFQR